MIDVERQCAVLQQTSAVEKYVVTNALGSTNSYLDSVVGRAQIMTRLRRRKSSAQAYKDNRKYFPQEAALQVHLACSSWRRSEEHTSELQSHHDLVCRLLLE